LHPHKDWRGVISNSRDIAGRCVRRTAPDLARLLHPPCVGSRRPRAPVPGVLAGGARAAAAPLRRPF
jgi:hypothetical protein